MSSALSSVGVVAGAGVFCVFAGGALTGIWTLGTFGLNRAVKGLTSHADMPEHLRRYYRAQQQEPATGLYAPMGHAYEPRTIG